MDTLHPEQAKLASTGGEDWGKLCGSGRASLLSLLASNAGSRSRRRLIFGLVLLLMGHAMSVLFLYYFGLGFARLHDARMMMLL